MIAERAAAANVTDVARLCADFARAAEASDIAAIAFDPAWVDHDGAGVTIGLIDSIIDLTCPDLAHADIVTQDFVGAPDHSSNNMAHGNCMAKLLVGQGRRTVRGMMPRARLVAARVVGPGDIATADRVEAAISWLMAMHVKVVAMPIGSDHEAGPVNAAIASGIASGVRYFAASGSGAGIILFPARHPSVVAVGPGDAFGRLSGDARRAPKLDLLAPGFGIDGASTGGSGANGSSIAATLAAGAAALGAEFAFSSK